MPKKILFAVLIVISLFLCSSAVNKAITYDNDFIISLAKGLDKRWRMPHQITRILGRTMKRHTI